MKNLKLILAAIFLFMVTAGVQAQTQKASIKEDAIVLDNTQTVQDRYTLDLSTFNFQSEEEARNYFESKNSQLVSYRVLFDDNVAIVFPQIKLKPEWTTENWNAYFLQHKVKTNESPLSQPQN